MTLDDTLNALRLCLEEADHIQPGEFRPEALMRHDLEVDSLHLIELEGAICDRLGREDLSRISLESTLYDAASSWQHGDNSTALTTRFGFSQDELDALKYARDGLTYVWGQLTCRHVAHFYHNALNR